jgi:cysteine desulfurase
MIYLDHNSTTPVDENVLEVMLPYFRENFGNAASRNHPFGVTAKSAVNLSRKQIASYINAEKHEIVFTSGATESINLGIKGFIEENKKNGNHIIVPKTEHKAVLDTCNALSNKGYQISYLDVENNGLINLENLLDTITPNTILIAVMHANNEIGVIQPISEIGAICQEKGIVFFVDAAQTFGKENIDVKKSNIDMLSASGHKIYGPKGIGFLYVNKSDKNIQIESLIDGGGHENGMRSGTLNVPGIVGFSEAAKIAFSNLQIFRKKELNLRNHLLKNLKEKLDRFEVNGDLTHRLAGNLNLSFEGVNGDALLVNMDDIAVSNGAACSSSIKEPSYVLKALGRNDALADASLRIGIGRDNTKEEIDYTVEKIVKVVTNLREIESLKEDLFL